MHKQVFFALLFISIHFCTNAMEHTPTPKSKNLFISIPPRSDDDESSPVTGRRTQATLNSPTKITQSGSPLLRLSQQNSARRNMPLSPDIQQEIQENSLLSPRDKKNLTPRSNTIYDYFGSDFFEESDSSDSLLLSKQPMPGDKQKNTLVVVDTQNSYIQQLTEEEIFPAIFSASKNMKSSFQLEPCFLLQLAMVHNDLDAVGKYLHEAKKTTAHAKEEALKAAQKAAEKAEQYFMALHGNKATASSFRKTQKAIIEALKAREHINTLIAGVAWVHAQRSDLHKLCRSPEIMELIATKSYFKGDQVVGLCAILLPAHLHKAKFGHQKHYLDDLSLINTLVWDAWQDEQQFIETLDEYFQAISLYTNSL